jgi:zinc protease
VLSNGIVALIQRNPSSPTVSIRGEIAVGSVHEPADKCGLSSFTGAALLRGTERRSFQQISQETEERACSVNSGGGLHHSGFSGKMLIEDLPLVLDILSDMLLHPAFPEREIEKLRGQLLLHLRESEDDTQYQANRAARTLLYPPDHPYSSPSGGTPATVASITRDDLIAFHGTYHPAHTTIAVVGDVEPEQIIALLEHYFGGWKPQGAPELPELPPVPPLSSVQRRSIALSGKIQTDIIWAVHGLRRQNPDYYAAMMANMVLGQMGMGGRLNENVREEQGMAYYIYSGIQADIGAGPWLAIAGVNPANVERAVEAMLYEIERFKREGPTDEELADVRAYLTGSLVLGLETNAGIAGLLLAIERHNLGLDFLQRYPAIVQSIGHAEMVDVTRRYLSTEAYVLTTAGPPEQAAQA